MPVAANTLDYLSEMSSFGGDTTDSIYGAKWQWHLSLDALRFGVLDAKTTASVFDAYAHTHPSLSFAEKSVPLLACLRSLRFGDKGEDVPLLLLRCEISAGGSLSISPYDKPWIPLDLLRRGGLFDNDQVICDVDAYRMHQIAMMDLPSDGSWGMAVERAVDLFEAVNRLDENTLTTGGARIERAECSLGIWEKPDMHVAASVALAKVRRDIGAEGEENYNRVSMSLRTLLGGADPDQQHPDQAREDDLVDRMLLAGLPGRMRHVTSQDRLALSTIVRQGRGAVVALRAPKGTNNVSVPVAAMADFYTERALRGERAPVMACVASSDTLRMVAKMLDDRPTESQTSLLSRWLPRIADTGDERDSRRVLGALSGLTLTYVHDGGQSSLPREALYQAFLHRGEGSGTQYLDPWYVPKATLHFLDCASVYLGTRVQDATDAAALLSEKLRRIDQDRGELIEAYAEVCKADVHMRERDDIVDQLVALRHEHSAYRKRLRYWQKVSQQHPIKKVFTGIIEPDQSEVIARYIDEGEELARGKTLVGDICTVYQGEVERIESEIDRLRGTSATLSRRVREASPEGQRCSVIVDRLAHDCRLDERQTKILHSTVDGHRVFMERLDSVLDRTVRPIEFWLALHIYEARWIETAQSSPNVARTLRSRGARSWRTLANFSPFNLIPDDLAVASLQNDGADGWEKAPVDFLVVLDAHHMDASTGLALISKSQQTVLVGSEGQVRNTLTFGDVADELHTQKLRGQQTWNDIVAQGAAASANSSIFDLVSNNRYATLASLVDVTSSYSDIVDLRCELVSAEPVRTRRLPASSADDPRYPLDRIVPSLSYVLVPDSAWEQTSASRKNVSEARAIMRWLSNRAGRILQGYGHARHPIAIVAPYHAQAATIQEALDKTQAVPRGAVQVVPLDEIGKRTWRMVIFSTTCGPDNYPAMAGQNTKCVLTTVAAAALDALVVFCNASWVKSANLDAQTFTHRAMRMGRLFSVARSRKKLETVPQVEGEGSKSSDKAQPNIEVDLRAKPMSLTRLLKRMQTRGDIEAIPATQDVNRALLGCGLIERHADADGRKGWRPTAAGREIGILPTTDRKGNPFCAYSTSTEPVILNVLDSIETDSSAATPAEP